MDTKLPLALLSLLTMLATTSSFFFFNAPSYGYFGPPDKHCITHSATLNCTLFDDNSFVSSDLEIWVYRKTKTETFNSSQLVIVDNKTALYTMDNLTLQDNNANMKCCIDGCNKTVGSVFLLQVYDLPRPVEDFSCVIYDYDANMNCSWTVPCQHCETSLKWRITFSEWTDCSDSQQTSCYWKNTSVGDFTQGIIEFNVTVKSDCPIPAENNYTIDSKSIVKPKPVDNLQCTVLNSRCIQVTWTPNRLEYKKIYQISYYRPRKADVSIINITDTEETKTQNKNETLCDLAPYTKYNFTVKVFPDKGGFWSEEKITACQTYEDVPSASPAVTTGGYRWADPWKCDNEIYRDITVYWKHLDDSDKNGEIRSIVVTTSPSIFPSEETVGIDATRKTILRLFRCDTAYNVSVQARTINGTSKVGSVIHIAAASAGVSLPEFIVETSKTQEAGGNYVYIEWDHAEAMNVVSYTVYWCKKDQGDCIVEKDSSIDWTVVPGNETSLMKNMPNPEYYLFGVSRETVQGNSGLSWTTCIYTRGVNASQFPTNVIVKEGNEDKTLSVTWNKLECASGEPYIDKYIILYCKADTENPCEGGKSMEVPSDVTSVMLTDLNADIEYVVQIQGVTKLGGLGPLSVQVYGTPVDNSLKAAEIVAIAVGGFLGLMFVVSGIWFTVRCIIARTKQRFKKPAIDDLLQDVDKDMGDFDNQNILSFRGSDDGLMREPPSQKALPERQLSNDSGVGDSPLTPITDDDKDAKFQQMLQRVKDQTIPDDYVQVTQDSSNESQNRSDSGQNGERIGNGYIDSVLNRIIINNNNNFMSEGLSHQVNHVWSVKEDARLAMAGIPIVDNRENILPANNQGTFTTLIGHSLRETLSRLSTQTQNRRSAVTETTNSQLVIADLHNHDNLEDEIAGQNDRDSGYMKVNTCIAENLLPEKSGSDKEVAPETSLSPEQIVNEQEVAPETGLLSEQSVNGQKVAPETDLLPEQSVNGQKVAPATGLPPEQIVNEQEVAPGTGLLSEKSESDKERTPLMVDHDQTGDYVHSVVEDSEDEGHGDDSGLPNVSSNTGEAPVSGANRMDLFEAQNISDSKTETKQSGQSNSGYVDQTSLVSPEKNGNPRSPTLPSQNNSVLMRDSPFAKGYVTEEGMSSSALPDLNNQTGCVQSTLLTSPTSVNHSHSLTNTDNASINALSSNASMNNVNDYVTTEQMQPSSAPISINKSNPSDYVTTEQLSIPQTVTAVQVNTSGMNQPKATVLTGLGPPISDYVSNTLTLTAESDSADILNQPITDRPTAANILNQPISDRLTAAVSDSMFANPTDTTSTHMDRPHTAKLRSNTVEGPEPQNSTDGIELSPVRITFPAANTNGYVTTDQLNMILPGVTVPDKSLICQVDGGSNNNPREDLGLGNTDHEFSDSGHGSLEQTSSDRTSLNGEITLFTPGGTAPNEYVTHDVAPAVLTPISPRGPLLNEDSYVLHSDAVLLTPVSPRGPSFNEDSYVLHSDAALLTPVSPRPTLNSDGYMITTNF